MRNVVINSSDFELFDPDITPQDYEFFQKHKGAFKGLLEDQVWTYNFVLKGVNLVGTFKLNYNSL